MMRFALSFLFTAVLASAVSAQEEKLGYERELGVQLRFTYIGGEAADGDSWHDFFQDSVGIGIQYTLLWRTSESFEVGGYLGFSYDSFSGEEHSVQSGGVTLFLRPEKLTLQRHTIGFASRFKLGSVSIEPRLGVGLAFYNGVDANVRNGAAQAEISAIEPSIEFTFEVGARASLPLSDRFGVTLGLSYERNSAPDADDDLGTSLNTQENVAIDIGLKYVF